MTTSRAARRAYVPYVHVSLPYPCPGTDCATRQVRISIWVNMSNLSTWRRVSTWPTLTRQPPQFSPSYCLCPVISRPGPPFTPALLDLSPSQSHNSVGSDVFPSRWPHGCDYPKRGRGSGTRLNETQRQREARTDVTTGLGDNEEKGTGLGP